MVRSDTHKTSASGTSVNVQQGDVDVPSTNSAANSDNTEGGIINFGEDGNAYDAGDGISDEEGGDTVAGYDDDGRDNDSDGDKHTEAAGPEPTLSRAAPEIVSGRPEPHESKLSILNIESSGTARRPIEAPKAHNKGTLRTLVAR